MGNAGTRNRALAAAYRSIKRGNPNWIAKLIDTPAYILANPDGYDF